MSKEFPAVPLGEILTSISRPEIVEPDKIYQILGAHWYAEGLYIKETKPGSEIQADKVYRIEQGDFVYNRLFAWKGSFAVATAKDDNCYVSNEFPAFTIDHRKVNAQYLRRYFCRASVWEEALGLSSGGTPTSRNRLKEDKLLSMRIPLPTPEEQQRIVARIEELVTKIEKARGLHNQVDSPESIYASTVASIIESHRNAWQKCKVSNVILSIDSGWSPQCLDQPVTGDLWGVLKTTAVQWGEFRSSENKAIPEFLDPKPELCVRSGDVLVTRAGPRKRVGVVASVRDDAPHLMISDKLIRIRPDRSKITPRFLEISLSSPLSQEYLIQRKTGLADAQVNISQNIIKATPITYPSLIAEQQSIITYLDEFQSRIGALKRVQAEISAELDAMLPSILDKAFKGEL